jgi:IclR family transcriptional regulator, KDG regulon repressor
MARRPEPAAVDKDAATEERGAQAIHRALTILEVFSTVNPSVSLTEISEYAGLTVPTAHRMVRALHSRGYVTHDPITGHYSLGSSVMKLAQVLLVRGEQDQLLTLSMPHLEALRDISDETVSLHVAVGNSRVCIAEFVSHQVVRMAMGVGRVFPIFAGAAGKALLSGMSDAALDEIIGGGAKLVLPGSSAVISPSRLKRELMSVREDRYATSDGETVAGAAAIAAPVFGPRGVEAAINIAGPATRWTRTAMNAAVPRLLETAATISEHLGYRHPDSAVAAPRVDGSKRKGATATATG